jgi:hypothetical protein
VLLEENQRLLLLIDLLIAYTKKWLTFTFRPKSSCWLGTPNLVGQLLPLLPSEARDRG